MFLNARWSRFVGRHVVGVSDAGVREEPEAGGAHVGMGWMLVDRDSQECIVAAQWYRWVERSEGGLVAEQDINLWEARAAKACLAAVVALRTARLGEVAAHECAPITAAERRSLKQKLFGPLGSARTT